MRSIQSMKEVILAKPTGRPDKLELYCINFEQISNENLITIATRTSTERDYSNQYRSAIYLRDNRTALTIMQIKIHL